MPSGAIFVLSAPDSSVLNSTRYKLLIADVDSEGSHLIPYDKVAQSDDAFRSLILFNSYSGS